MKNIFKLMGIALIAGSMFVACGEKENGGEDTTPSVSVTFDGTNYNTFASQVVSTGTTQGQDWIDFRFSPTALQQAQTVADLVPGFEVMLLGNAAGSFESTGVNANGYLTGSVFVYEWYAETALQDENGTLYGDWWAQSAKVELTKFDVTAKLASLEGTGKMFDAYNALVEQMGIEAAPKADMTVSLKNITIAQ